MLARTLGIPAVLFAALLALGCGSDATSGGDGGGGATTQSSGGGSNAGGAGGEAGSPSNGGSAGEGGSAGQGGSGGSGGATPSPDPVATITSPTEGSTFAVDDSIPFAGTAIDPKDGALSGAAMIWTGDFINPEGQSTSGSASFDTAGMHTLTLTATDSDGHKGVATVHLVIQ